MSLSEEQRTKTVEIEPPAEIVKHARRRAGDDGDLEEHLLDHYVFEYEWIGVETNK